MDLGPEALVEDCNYNEKSGGSWNEESEDMGRAHDRTVGYDTSPQITTPELYHIEREGEVHQKDRPDADNKSSDGDGSENNNDKIETGEDDDIDSDGALGRDKNKLSGFKFLGSSTTEVGVEATLGMKLVDDSSFDENPGTCLDDKAILDREKESG
ncbi:unnamed protein product [Tuber aestivum]|uniref:Uncharacterized protein n=1 Tax=Tuber aestivum TaxID=59557 RepID=A0A292PW59_9PEZI|nr:unnamed protein product [Tuber aestivum]